MSATPSTKTYVLLHGSFCGAWTWEGVRRELGKLGCAALAPELPGHGDDATPRAGITHEHYVEALASFLEERGVHDAVLVAHSAAGATATLAAPRLRPHINELIFLTAIIPDAETSLLERVPPGRRAYYEQSAKESDDYSFWPQSNRTWKEGETRFNREPMRAYEQPVLNASFDPAMFRQRRYIRASADELVTDEEVERWSTRVGVESVEAIDSGHSPMHTHPVELAHLLTNPHRLDPQ